MPNLIQCQDLLSRFLNCDNKNIILFLECLFIATFLKFKNASLGRQYNSSCPCQHHTQHFTVDHSALTKPDLNYTDRPYNH